MHIPDGVLNGPTAAGTALVALGAVGLGVRRLQTETRTCEQLIPLLGILAAFVFAAQMVNFPIPGGTSGHLMGAALAAVFLGPWGAMVVLALVLAVQCFIYADGGVIALGANVFNMAVVGSAVGNLAYRAARVGSRSPGRVLVAAGIGAWISIVAAALACAVELALSSATAARAVIPAMTYVHMVIGVGEALITVTVVAAVVAARPELIPGVDADATRGGRVRLAVREVTAAVAVCLAVAMVVSAFASAAPDGLEKVAETFGFAPQAAAGGVLPAPMPDYGIPQLGEGFFGTALAGGSGVVILLAVGYLLYRRTGRSEAP